MALPSIPSFIAAAPSEASRRRTRPTRSHASRVAGRRASKRSGPDLRAGSNGMISTART